MINNNYSAIDDSLIIHNGIYIYTHCLINSQENHRPEYLSIIRNDKYSIYDEEKIVNFINDNLIPGNELYACSHYHTTYPNFEDLGFNEISRNLIRKSKTSYQKGVIRLFKKADIEARTMARIQKEGIEELIYERLAA